MKKLLCIGFLISSISAEAALYCKCEKFQAETRFDGQTGTAGNAGKIIYFGVNNSNSDNSGMYLFKTGDDLILEFPGEQRHFCKKISQFNWDCQRGKTLKYSLLCEF